jgi:N utilization substance protein A
MSLEGMTSELAEQFNARGINTVDELAEQSIDDLLDISDITEEQAGALIMKAREPWFK